MEFIGFANITFSTLPAVRQVNKLNQLLLDYLERVITFIRPSVPGASIEASRRIRIK